MRSFKAYPLGRLKDLDGSFDLIFMDSNPNQYSLYFDMIFDRKLLAPDGVILIDNGMQEHIQSVIRFR